MANKKRGQDKSLFEKEIITNSLKKIIWGAGVVFLGRILGKFIGYFYVMFVARLGTEEYGMLNLGFSIASLFIVFSLLGFNRGLLRYIPFYLARKDSKRVKGALFSTIKLSLPLSLFSALLMFFSSEYISINLFHNPSLIPILKIFSLMVPFTVLAEVFMTSLRAFQRVDYDVFNREILEKTVRLCFALLLVFIGFGIFGASVSYVISALAVCGLSLFLLERKVFPFLKTKIKPIYYTKELLFYSFPLLFAGFFQFIIGWTDTLMLGYFRTTSEVGIYNAALPTAALMFVLPGALTSLFMPIITQFYSKNKKEGIMKVYDSVSRWVFVVNLPVFLLMFAFSSQILRIIFGQDYIAAATVLPIIAFGYLIYSLAFTSNGILNMLKKTNLVFITNLVFAITNLLLNYLFIPKYGIIGAAIATSLSFIMGGLAFFIFSFRLARLQPFKMPYLKILLSSLISIIIVFSITRILFKPVPIYGFLVMFAVYGIIYLLLLAFLRCFEKEDIELVKIIFAKFINKNK